MLNNKVTIIIPIFNEEENISLLIYDILNNYKNINILVIDDFSNDKSVLRVLDTIKDCGNKIKLIKKTSKIDLKGLTNSIIKGINNLETDYFIVMDGDFQHPVINITNFLYLFDLGNNIVIGERKKILFPERKYRIIISKIGNYLINLKLHNKGLKIRDPLSGFFGGETKIFQDIIKNNQNKFINGGYKFLFEFLKLINKNRFVIGLFDYNFEKRRFGKSKINLKVIGRFILSLLK